MKITLKLLALALATYVVVMAVILLFFTTRPSGPIYPTDWGDAAIPVIENTGEQKTIDASVLMPADKNAAEQLMVPDTGQTVEVVR